MHIARRRFTKVEAPRAAETTYAEEALGEALGGAHVGRRVEAAHAARAAAVRLHAQLELRLELRRAEGAGQPSDRAPRAGEEMERGE